MFKTLSLAGAAAAVFLFGSVALAGGNGAQTFTQHAHDTNLPILSIVPPPDLPANCPIPLPAAIVPTSGNAVQHDTSNKTGFWFTTTTTANVDIFAGVVIDEDQDVAPTGPVLFTGKATLWFGDSDNLQNEATHATLDFHGTSATDGSSLRIHANFGTTTNANGVITAAPLNITCVVS
jgi:hypothetical protein